MVQTHPTQKANKPVLRELPVGERQATEIRFLLPYTLPVRSYLALKGLKRKYVCAHVYPPQLLSRAQNISLILAHIDSTSKCKFSSNEKEIPYFLLLVDRYISSGLIRILVCEGKTTINHLEGPFLIDGHTPASELCGWNPIKTGWITTPNWFVFCWGYLFQLGWTGTKRNTCFDTYGWVKNGSFLSCWFKGIVPCTPDVPISSFGWTKGHVS